MVTQNARAHHGRDARRAHFDEVRRNSLWIVPTATALAAIVLSQVTLLLDEHISDSFRNAFFTTSVEDARQLVSVITASMLTFMGVVFSITLVALQLTSTQYSPRVVRSFVRSPLTKWTLGVFMATFVFSFNTLASFDSNPATSSGKSVPSTSVAVAYLLVLASLFVFIGFVHSIVKAMRVTFVIKAVAEETRTSIVLNFPREEDYTQIEVPELGEPDARVIYDREAGVLAGVGIDQLLRTAKADGAIFVLPQTIGSYLTYGSVIVEVHGRSTPSEEEITRAFDVGVERTLYQDPAYGFRQLVDVAIRALSPAVNDPTTAVQVLDRLTDLLARLAERPQGNGLVLDEDGQLRLVQEVHTWDEFLDLAFTEIRYFGVRSPQIPRRLSAAIEVLRDVVPERCVAGLDRQRELLTRSVAAHVTGDELEAALAPDRLGLG